MNWNPALDLDTNGNHITKVTFDSDGNDGISKVLCTHDRIDNGYASGFSALKTSNQLEKAIGVTLDGVLLVPKLDQYNVDGSWSGKYIDNWYPGHMSTDAEVTAYKSTLTVDIDSCLGMVSSTGEYHYSSASSCIIG
mmetsp:Transcript_40750/g.53461  ORF Transcript_40750/g.53461 Transcript_40750/m.53461 type:complete len:137 (+) Transcript_40750:381-791(+)|eukprot:CAMPEP_0170450932 /NCGR_PEP_ID=MMETSP0123-20130129/316_1 /TAXON_ID=182087 /ORGANISM="Favella ehrenbergii, Strain Fehren 1" /LENGTH=136 /DNA_ID=CAMNT_0010712403 /DNA_START=307 /DNA_END=717 /DNA_ORIENTATION=+